MHSMSATESQTIMPAGIAMACCHECTTTMNDASMSFGIFTACRSRTKSVIFTRAPIRRPADSTQKKTVAEATVKIRNKLHKGYICFVCHSARVIGESSELPASLPGA
jgi:hypothetical protein